MTTQDLMVNFAGTWGTGGSGTGAFSYATPFRVNGGIGITRIAWFRPSTTTQAPTFLRLYDSGGQLYYAAPTVPDNGSVGWQWHTLTLPVITAPGITYEVADGFNSGGGEPNAAPGNWPTLPSLYTTTANRRCWANGSNSFPNNCDAIWMYGLNVTVDDTITGDQTPPITNADVENSLAAWLSTTDGTHSDSAPLQDHATLATVDTTTGAIHDQTVDWAFGLGAAAHGYFDTIKTLINTIKGETDNLPPFIAAVTDIMLDHYTADIDAILDQIDTILAGLALPNASAAGTAGQALGALSARAPFPGTGWFLAAEDDFTDEIAFDAIADAYVLTITSWQDSQPANSSPAGTWLPRLGWWCVLTGSLASQRQFVDFAEMLLTDNGRRMQACAIQLRPGTVAHVQAWQLA